MITFMGQSIDSVDTLLAAGNAIALGTLALRDRVGEDDLGGVSAELLRLAVDRPDDPELAYALGRMAGEIQAVWRRFVA